MDKVNSEQRYRSSTWHVIHRSVI